MVPQNLITVPARRTAQLRVVRTQCEDAYLHYAIDDNTRLAYNETEPTKPPQWPSPS